MCVNVSVYNEYVYEYVGKCVYKCLCVYACECVCACGCVYKCVCECVCTRNMEVRDQLWVTSATLSFETGAH